MYLLLYGAKSKEYQRYRVNYSKFTCLWPQFCSKLCICRWIAEIYKWCLINQNDEICSQRIFHNNFSCSTAPTIKVMKKILV